eukprot:gene28118-33952_t
MLGQIVLRIKEHVADGGLHGVVYANVLADLGISHPIGLYIAKTFLFPAQYRFSGDADINNLTEIPKDLVCYCPKHLLLDFYGLEGIEEVSSASSTEEFNALQTVGLSRKAGITASEIICELGSRAAVVYFDKLSIYDIIVKRMLMPKLAGGKNARSQGAVTIYHLKRYARSFDAEDYSSQLSATDHMRDIVLEHLFGVLDSHNIPHLACIDLGKLFKLPKRIVQYVRNLTTAQLSSSPIRFVEKESYAMSLKNSNNLSRFKRVLWCMERADPAQPTMHSGFYRMSNLPLFDQLARQLQALGQVGSSDVRKLLSVGRKKATKLVSLFITKYKFPSIKVQEGKNNVFKILPKVFETDEHEEKAGDNAQKADRANRGRVEPSSLGRFTADQEERMRLILDYLDNSPYRLGSMLEVVQLIRKAHRDRGREGMVDGKTVRRTIGLMSGEVGLYSGPRLSLIEVPLTEEQRGSFLNYPSMDIIYYAAEADDRLQERTQDYLNSYSYVKFLPMKKKIAGKKSPEDDMDRVDVEDDADTSDSDEDFIDDDDDGAKKRQTGKKRKNAEQSGKVGGKGRGRPKKASRNEQDDQVVNECNMEVIELPSIRKTMEDQKEDDQTAEEMEIIVADPTPKKKARTGSVRKQLPRVNVPKEIEEEDNVADFVIIEPRDVSHPQPSMHASLDEWTPVQDAMALCMFVSNVCVRQARLGLPHVLKPVHKAIKTTNAQRTVYLHYPETSALGVRYLHMDVHMLRECYVPSNVSIHSHTPSSVKKHVSVLINKFRTMQDIVVYVLYMLGLQGLEDVGVGGVGGMGRRVLEYLLQQRPELDYTHGQGKEEEFLDRGSSRPFTIGDLLPADPSDPAVNRSFIRVLRELYMHGFIVRKGADMYTYHTPHAHSLQQASANAFYFPQPFLQHPLSLPMGSVYDELLKGGGRLLMNDSQGSGLNYETHFVRTTLLYLHQLTSLAYGLHKLANTPDSAVNFLQSCVQINVGVTEAPDQEHPEPEQPKKIQFSNQDQEQPLPTSPYVFYDSTHTPASDGGVFAKAMSRLTVCLTSTWSGAGGTGWSCWEGGWNEDRVKTAHMPHVHIKSKLPWIRDNKSEDDMDVEDNRSDKGDWNVNMTIFTWFAHYVIVILSQRPGITLVDIHANILVLPVVSLHTLLKVLEEMKVVKSVVAGAASRFIRMGSAFDSEDIWNDAQEEDCDEGLENVFYELSFELSPGA